MAEIWALALHGGADVSAKRSYDHVETHLADLLARASAELEAGKPALDVVEMAVRDLESCGHHIAGKGASPNQEGLWELDAAIMDGWTQNAGAVAGLIGFIHPISVAREVLSETDHILIAGSGAEAFADRSGHKRVLDPDTYYTPSVAEPMPANAPGHGTVGAVARDRAGRLASATSTGGLLNKTPGRVGDSPIIGAGTWADRGVAISCTGQGEYFLRCAAASSVSAHMRFGGQSLKQAAEEAIRSVGELGGQGGLIAVDAAGNVAMPFNGAGMKRAMATSTGTRQVQIFP